MSTNLANDGEEAATTLPPEYTLNGKIMLTAIVVLFFVVVLMFCLHLYARWYLLRLRRRNRRDRRTRIVFHDNHSAVSAAEGDAGGLDEAVLKSLPVFVYDSRAEAAPLECAVCLSEFEEGETGRVLPKCKHSFHIECINMWFHSHSTCPLCRCAVESGPVPESSSYNPNDDVALNVCGGPAEVNELAGTSSGLCSECGSGSNRGLRQTASFAQRRKPMDITVPSRHESFGRLEAEPSPLFRSPMSRMLSFKRILSRERRNGGVSPSGNASCSSVAEFDIERGREGAE